MASLSPEKLEALNKEKAKNHSGGNFFKMTSDKSTIRVLPFGATEQMGVKHVAYWINNKPYTCNEATHGQPGIIARVQRALSKLEDDQAQELAEGLDSARRTSYLLKIIDRAIPDKVQVYKAPKIVYETIIRYSLDEGIDVADATDGYDFRISKEGTNKNTKYTCTPARNASPLVSGEDGEPDRAAIKELRKLSSLIDIEALVRADEAGALSALQDTIPKPIWRQIRDDVMLEESGGKDDEDADDEDAEPVKPAKKKAAPVEADDEDIEPVKPQKKKAAPVDDDEDVEPVKPAKKKAAPVDEDADGDEPTPPKRPKTQPVDDEDAEPVKPAKKKAAPVEADDEDAEPVKPAKKAAPSLDDDDEEPVPARTPVRKFKP